VNSPGKQQENGPAKNSFGSSTHINPEILIAQDDSALATLLGYQLEAESCVVDLVHDGEQAVAKLESQKRYDLLILDLTLPKIDGIGVLDRIRPVRPRLPILILTALTRIEDKANAFHHGADDYLIKPFSLIELLARARALMRRNSGAFPNSSRVGDLTLHRQEHRVERNGRRIELTPREFSILEFMMRHAGCAVSRASLFENVWNVPHDPTTNIVDVYVKYVRDKVDLPGERPLMRTIRGVGYELCEQ
jgi:DNA-binding response OmpR family regulator